MKSPKFPIPSPIDWTKYIEPKFQIYVTMGNVTTTDLVSEAEYKRLLANPGFKEYQDKIRNLNS
jgi:hypothetical protein